jgi:hypothetical protein
VFWGGGRPGTHRNLLSFIQSNWAMGGRQSDASPLPSTPDGGDTLRSSPTHSRHGPSQDTRQTGSVSQTMAAQSWRVYGPRLIAFRPPPTHGHGKSYHDVIKTDIDSHWAAVCVYDTYIHYPTQLISKRIFRQHSKPV